MHIHSLLIYPPCVAKTARSSAVRNLSPKEEKLEMTTADARSSSIVAVADGNAFKNSITISKLALELPFAHALRSLSLISRPKPKKIIRNSLIGKRRLKVGSYSRHNSLIDSCCV
eukprot:UN03791